MALATRFLDINVKCSWLDKNVNNQKPLHENSLTVPSTQHINL